MTVRAAIVAALLIGVLSSVTVCQAQTLKVAVVDMDSISQQYKELTDRQAELQNWVKDRKSFLNTLQDFMFLSSDEFQEIGRILQTPKEQWTEPQKAREAQLRRIGEDNERRFLDLQAMAARKPEEQNQYNVLRDTFQARDRDLKAISRTFDDQLRARRDELQGKLATNVQKVIEQLAKTQGFTFVLDKSVVYFAADTVVDITAEVLKSLNVAGAGTAAPGGAENAGGAPKP